MIITEIAVLVLICSAASIGVYAACGFDGDENFDLQESEVKLMWPKPTDDQKMILWWVRYYGGRYLGKFWYKPVYGCLPCMGGIHSLYPTLVYLNYADGNFLLMWPLIALATIGVNFLVTKIW